MTGKADAVRAVSQQFKDRTNAVIEGVMAHLNDANAKEILGPGLSPLIGRGSLKSIVTFALYADVLRMVRDMVMADGEISDEEVQESFGVLSVIAGGFAKVRSKDYSAFAQLSSRNARQFLAQYESDAGLFGHANEATKWAGVGLCRNLHTLCNDAGPLDRFGGSLLTWAEVITAADAASPAEAVVLKTLSEVVGLKRTDKPKPTSQLEDALAGEEADLMKWRLTGASSAVWLEDRKGRLNDWLTKAQDGDPRAQNLVALCYDFGIGVEQDKDEAVRWYRNAAKKGHASAMYNLGVCYACGEGVDEDKEEAVRWYRAAAEKGDTAAMCNLGICYGCGEGIEEDENEAVRWLRMAADRGDADAMFALGTCYDTGIGVGKDEQEAMRFYRAAAALGHLEAKERISRESNTSAVLSSEFTEKGQALGDEERVLTKELAEHFVADNEAVDLNTFTALEDDAAEVLAAYRFEIFGACLDLDGLKSLSLASATSLASHDGDLSLCGLETLSPELATALAKSKHRLQLGGLISLSDAAADALAEHTPSRVRFHLVTTSTLSIGTYSGGCELSARGLKSLALYRGCLELTCDFSEKLDDPEWQEPLRIFNARQDQRVFKVFTEEMQGLLATKDLSPGPEADAVVDWVFDDANGESAWEIYNQVKDLIIACGNRPLWSGPVGNENGANPIYFLLGHEDDVLDRIRTLPDKE